MNLRSHRAFLLLTQAVLTSDTSGRFFRWAGRRLCLESLTGELIVSINSKGTFEGNPDQLAASPHTGLLEELL